MNEAGGGSGIGMNALGGGGAIGQAARTTHNPDSYNGNSLAYGQPAGGPTQRT